MTASRNGSKQRFREIKNQPDDRTLLENTLQAINVKLAKLADAVESIGISDTLAGRLSALEQEKSEVEAAIRHVKAPVKFAPTVIPALIERWRELVRDIEAIGANPAADLAQVDAASASLRGLLGDVTLEPKNGVLWAHPKTKGLTEMRPLHELRIKSSFGGSGGVICTVPTVRTRIRLI